MTIRVSALALVVCSALLMGTASPVWAQDAGVRAGASADPDQFYVGVHADVGPIAEALRFRPNVEVGFGNDLTLVAFNFELLYPIRLENTAWSFYPGIGPALNVVKVNGNTDTGGGLNIVFGLQHQDGFFVEMKVGTIDSPDFKFGVGYTFR